MAMTILNNTSAMMTLGELNKNINRVGKDLRKVASGQKLNGASDGASEYAISEKMRVRLRALGQNEQNVQTGTNLLRTAEGGVQEQIEILKTIKEKVIDANNDTNTEKDRATIQKEIDQGFKQMEQIAQETNYNGRRLLAGDVHSSRNEVFNVEVMRPVLYQNQPIWTVFDEAQFIENSSLDMIPDNYDVLDGIEGPFDVFEQITSSTGIVAIDKLGLAASDTANAFTGGENGDPKVLSFDLSQSYSSVSELDGVGFTLGGRYYVLTTDTSKHYKTDSGASCTQIDISGCTSLANVATAMANQISNGNYDISASGSTVTFSTAETARTLEYINSTPGLEGFSAAADSEQINHPAQKKETAPVYNTVTATAAISDTGSIADKEYLTGGKNNIPEKGSYVPNGTTTVNDKTTTNYVWRVTQQAQDGRPASTTVDFSSATAGSGVTVHGSSDGYIIFSDDAAGPELLRKSDDANTPTSPTIYTVGKNYKGEFSMCGMTVNMAGSPSSVKFIALTNSAAPNNNWYVGNVDGNSVSYTYQVDTGTTVVTQEAKDAWTETVNYEPITALDISGLTTTNSDKGAIYAHYDMTLSDDLKTRSKSVMESFIADMTGKTLNHKYGNSYSFYDSAVLQDPMCGSYNDGMNGDHWLDLNDIRKSVAAGKDVFTAVQDLLADGIKDTEKTSTGLDFQADRIGEPGNSESLYVTDSGAFIHYDLDFSKVSSQIPGGLYGKGFRVYCGADSEEWWNFELTRVQGDFDLERPESSTAGEDIKTLRIDVSKAKNAGDVVKAIYEQTHDILTGANSKYNHNLRLEANTATGVLRLYDARYESLTEANGYLDRQGVGDNDGDGVNDLDLTYGWWKIADGLFDNVVVDTGDKWIDTPFMEEQMKPVGQKDLVIHDNPKANMNIHIKIPPTTLDKVFDFDKSEHSVDEFNVMTKEMREKLLGNDDEQGILDKGILYLTDANVLIGSQISRLAQSERNIVTASENTQSAESTIRDADMAKAMTEYTKSNVLSQAAQSMLAQANQNASSVLGLLQ